MKTKIILFVTSLLLFTFLSGCIATHNGYLTDSASLNSPNFIYKKKDVVGEAKATYVLGIGGVARQSLVLEAKKQMLALNPLQKNQALANVTASFKTTYFIVFIVVTTKCTVSADIVEFVSDQTNIQLESQIAPASTPQNSNSISEDKSVKPAVKNLETTKLKVGDKVTIINYFNTSPEGTIKKIDDNNVVVEYVNSSGKTKEAKVLLSQVKRRE